MNDLSSNGPVKRSAFSAFWPLTILLLTLLGLQILALVRTFDQRKQLEANIEQLQKVEAEANRVDAALGAVSRDLLDLAVKNTNARRVVTDFQIRQNASATNAPTGPAN